MTTLPPVVTVTLNPAIDQTLSIPNFTAGRVNRVAASRTDAGGKGVNVAVFLADLGDRVVATGFLGRDNANIFEQAFASRGIEDRFVRLDGATRVGIKVIDEQSHQTTDINFPGLTPPAEAIETLCGQIDELACDGGWFVLCGSVPTGPNPDIYARLIGIIRKRGGQVALDTSGAPLKQAIERGPDIVKPNVSELEELVGGSLGTPAAVTAAARSLLRHGISLVAVSMGGDGAIFVDHERALLARPPRVTVASTVGAGDAMVSGIVHARERGLPLDDGARLATALGAYAVTRIGPGLDRPGAHESLLRQVSLQTLD